MIHTLREFYGLQPTPPADIFQFCVWEVLSEQSLPGKRDLAWQALRRIPALTPDAMFRAPSKALLDAIALAGPNREDKLDRIRTIVGEFKRHRDVLRSDQLSRVGPIAAARALRRLEHLSPAARARALLFCVGRAVLPIDDDVRRVVTRLMGDADERCGSIIRSWLSARLPPEIASYREAVIYLRHHAQHTCLRVAPHCGVCPLKDRCRSVQRRDSTT